MKKAYKSTCAANRGQEADLVSARDIVKKGCFSAKLCAGEAILEKGPGNPAHLTVRQDCCSELMLIAPLQVI